MSDFARGCQLRGLGEKFTLGGSASAGGTSGLLPFKFTDSGLRRRACRGTRPLGAGVRGHCLCSLLGILWLVQAFMRMYGRTITGGVIKRWKSR